jgi:hypothetical protein
MAQGQHGAFGLDQDSKTKLSSRATQPKVSAVC